MPGIPVTIKDIAKRLGLSTSTVSRAIRDSAEINPETRAIVRQLAKELGYSPNPIALSLKDKKTKVIGVLVPEIAIYFCAAVIAGIEDKANSLGYHVMIFQSHETYEKEVSCLQLMKARRVDGVIISVSSETSDGMHLTDIIDSGIPLVMFDRICDEVAAPKVITDDAEGAYNATCHLLEQGFRRIAHIGMANHLSITQSRMRGYTNALEKYKVPLQEKWKVYCCFEYSSMKEAVENLLQTNPSPDAILVSGERLTFHCIEALREMNIQIPGDIALAGFFDNPVGRFINPSITSVRQPTFDIGQSAAQLLIEMIENGKPSSRDEIIELKTRLDICTSSLMVNKFKQSETARNM